MICAFATTSAIILPSKSQKASIAQSRCNWLRGRKSSWAMLWSKQDRGTTASAYAGANLSPSGLITANDRDSLPDGQSVRQPDIGYFHYSRAFCCSVCYLKTALELNC